ncbi:MAG: glycosyltransferase [Ectothiorhodospiraceae bacterium]
MNGSQKSTSPRPDLAIFMATSGHSGVDRVVQRLVPAVAARGLRVDLLGVEGHGPRLEPLPTGVRRIPLNARHTLTSLPALVRYLRRERPRALLSDKDKVNRAALLARALAGTDTRVVVRSGSHLTTALAQRGGLDALLQPWSVRLFYRFADGIITPSRDAAEDLAAMGRLAPGGVTAVPSPVVSDELLARAAEEPSHPWFADGGPPVILGVGELSSRKDFSTLIRAFARVRAEQPCRLVIFGKGRQASLLKALAADLGVAEDVDLPGFTDNPYAHMARCACFALTSTCEGSPVVLIEALACGAPVVSTDCPSGPRETLDGGRYGRLVPMGDVAAVAEGLRDALAGRLKNPGRDAVEPFTAQASADAYLRALGLVAGEADS